MVRKRKARSGKAQLKVRLPEVIRRQLEWLAKRNGHSMNTEIVRRLEASVGSPGEAQLVARILLRDLDDAIVNELAAELDELRRKDALLQDDWRHGGPPWDAYLQRTGEKDPEPKK
jgi:hypothetical protein